MEGKEVGRETSAPCRASPCDCLEVRGGRRRQGALEDQGLVDVMHAPRAVVQDDGPDLGASRKLAADVDVKVHPQSSAVRVHFPRAWMQVTPASTRRTWCPK